MENPSFHLSWLPNLVSHFWWQGKKGFLEKWTTSFLALKSHPTLFFFFPPGTICKLNCFLKKSITSAFPNKRYTSLSRKCKQSYRKTWHIQWFQEVTICPSVKHTHWYIPVNSFIHLHISCSLCSNKLGHLKFFLKQTDYKSIA